MTIVCDDISRYLEKVRTIFLDPPDNIGLQYNGFVDKNANYYDWLENIITKM